MTRGDKPKHTEKQKRQAKHIEEGYEERGISKAEAEKRAWSTVNKMYEGGAKGGSGNKEVIDKSPSRKGGRKEGKAAGKRKDA